MYLISGTHYSCESMEYVFMVLRECTIISHVKRVQIQEKKE